MALPVPPKMLLPPWVQLWRCILLLHLAGVVKRTRHTLSKTGYHAHQQIKESRPRGLVKSVGAVNNA